MRPATPPAICPLLGCGALENTGFRVVLGDHRIEAVAASNDDARLLGLRRSSPLLQVSRTTVAQGGRVAEVAVDRHVAAALVAMFVRTQVTAPVPASAVRAPSTALLRVPVA
jgi:hypothetical protein